MWMERLKFNMDDFPCVCSHKKTEHKQVLSGLVCLVLDSDKVNFADKCLEYRPDNLKYLE